MYANPLKFISNYSTINIIGAGCIGHLLALRFLKTQNKTSVETDPTPSINVNLYTRMTRQGSEFEYHSPTNTFSHSIQYSLLKDWKQPDLIIICVKSPKLNELCSKLCKQLSYSDSLNKQQGSTALLSTTTPILIMMNGMGLMEVVSSYFPKNPIFQAVTTHGAKIEGETNLEKNTNSERSRLIHTGLGETTIGSFSGEKNRQQQEYICALLNQYLPTVHFSQNFDQSLWKKLLINSVINPLTAIYGIENGQIISDSVIKHEANQLCLELTPFIFKLNVFDADFQLFEKVCLVAEQTKSNISSMRQDHMKHQPSEIDSITGYLLNQAKKLQIDLPLHNEIYIKIKRLENQF